ncbi:hypothetical protein SBC2_85240 (plasmid) [Caballeronia sp. SBC2]|nr:hypothetical protein SBC2_85240 [Caballeronia sp. SBC2]
MLFRLWQATPYHDSLPSGPGETGLYRAWAYHVGMQCSLQK